jgi:hypothetical protein
MNNELVKTFTPTYKDSDDLDRRFEEDLAIIFKDVRPEVIEGLNEFKEKTTDLENKYGSLAYELACLFIKRINEVERKEDQETNLFKWRTKALRKKLSKGLQERGFKPSNVSKIIGAAEYVLHLKHMGNTKVLDFVKELPISFQYLLSCMNPTGVSIAMSYEMDSKEWDPKTDTFIGKPLSKKALEEILSWNSKNPKKTFNLKPHSDDPTPITEVVLERSKESMTQLELIDELVQIVGHIDVPNIYKDKDIIERISIVSEDIWSIAHLAKLPIPTT